ncbi:MAG TPA: protein kinase [Candidatus Sulfotelmatobacter sp.]|nr:protein kinase [Candidatus Sulfotelmatobacter sp.]
MTLTAGTKLGPYEIVGPLGAGGMGEVYRAKDTRLERIVAIKILPVQFTAEPSARQRFEREAKVISGLNHPHICVLFDVGNQDGVEYLVMEYVEGDTLAKRLEKGPLPIEQVLKYGAQIAQALDKAHRSGIVHRDLKPSNIMLTVSGAKLLDFGLAKECAPLGNLATITATGPASPVTQQGTIVGTFQYMSPEQVEGKVLDGRSDLFSLGAVLYEMVTGKRAFDGKSQLSVASSILEREPAPLRESKPVTPPVLEHAIQRCLAKDPEERWQAARDLGMELDWIAKSGSSRSGEAAAVVGREKRWSRNVSRLGWLLCGALVVSLLAGALWWRNRKEPERTMVFTAPLPFPVRDMAMGPDGRTVAVAAHQEGANKGLLWLYEIGAEEARSLPGTEGGNFPFWSPDGKALGFFADGKLKRVDLPNGPVQVLADAPAGRGGTWSKDGVILFTPTGRLQSQILRVSAVGGTTKVQVGRDPGLGGGSQRWPQFLPDGKHFLFLSAMVSSYGRNDGLYVGSLDSKEYHLVMNTEGPGLYAEPGYLLYLRDRAIIAQRFDAKTMQLSGDPMAVANDPQFLPRILRVTFSAVDTGALLLQKGGNVSLSRLTWYNREGKEEGTLGEPQVYANPRISENGKQVAVDQTDTESQNTDVWTYDVGSGGAKRLTFDPALDARPVWSGDGLKVVFASSRGNAFNLFVKEANGAEQEKAICETDMDKYPSSWSRDGKYILYQEGPDLKYLTVPEMKSTPYLKATATLRNAQFSPDGKWVAYDSNESGKWEVYVTSFPEATGKWQVSHGGGEQSRWRGDEKELFYLSPDAKIMAVPVKSGAGFDPGVPVALFQTNPRETLATSEQYVYDVDASGQKFLVNALVKGVTVQPMTVVLHWGK